MEYISFLIISFILIIYDIFSTIKSYIENRLSIITILTILFALLFILIEFIIFRNILKGIKLFNKNRDKSKKMDNKI
jgi:nitrogen fixation/metabolism regulation signal transduction histidine kinase